MEFFLVQEYNDETNLSRKHSTIVKVIESPRDKILDIPNFVLIKREIFQLKCFTGIDMKSHAKELVVRVTLT